MGIPLGCGLQAVILKMHSTLLMSVLATIAVGARATYVPSIKITTPAPRRHQPTPNENGYGYDKPEAKIVTVTLTEQTTTTTTALETATHQVFVTQTRDVMRTETLNTARWFTAEVTSHV